MAQENRSVVTEFLLQGLSSQPRMQAVLFIVFLFFYLFTVVGNTAIITVVRAGRQLRSPMYFFLANPSFLDICYVSTNVPQMLVNLSTQKKTVSFSGCAAQMSFSLAFGMTECILLVTMAYDRCMVICQPLHHPTVMNGKLWACLALASWASSLLSSVVINSLVLRLPFCGPDTLNHYFCEVPAVLALACADIALTETVVFIFSILNVFIPFLLIIISYGQILATVLQIRPTHRQAKAFSTRGSHLTVVTVFYGTAICMHMTPRPGSPRDGDKGVAVFHTVVTPMLNAVIYSLRNEGMRGALRRALARPKSPFI